MQWLASISVRRPVFATVLILSLTVIGAFSFSLLGVDQFPKVDLPTIVVTTIQPGAAPEQIETEITDKIEEAVNTISGIDELRSTSSESVSLVMVSFLLDKNADVAAQEVRDKVSAAMASLPKTIDPPRIERFDPDAAPVISIALSANKPIRDVTEYADKVLRRQLESVTGVGQVLVLGGRRTSKSLADASIRAHSRSRSAPAAASTRSLKWATSWCARRTATQSASSISPASKMARPMPTRWRTSTAPARCCSTCGASQAPTRWRS
jgi:Cu/Ag efflux pump CusA